MLTSTSGAPCANFFVCNLDNDDPNFNLTGVSCLRASFVVSGVSQTITIRNFFFEILDDDNCQQCSSTASASIRNGYDQAVSEVASFPSKSAAAIFFLGQVNIAMREFLGVCAPHLSDSQQSNARNINPFNIGSAVQNHGAVITRYNAANLQQLCGT